MSVSADGTLRCALCGHELVPAALPCHAACPLGPRCGLICCPNCGFQVVDESRSLVGRLVRGRPFKRLASASRRTGSTPAVPLTHVPKGTEVEIRSLRDMPSKRAARLSAFGVVPGTAVTLVQRRPVPVIRIGETDLALSEEILGEIWVAPVAARLAPSGPV